MPLQAYLTLSAVLFSIGLFGVITRRNTVGILLGVELMLNAVNINLVAFSAALNDLTGQVMAMFVLTVAAAEAAIALAIVLNFFNRYQTIHLDEDSELKQ